MILMLFSLKWCYNVYYRSTVNIGWWFYRDSSDLPKVITSAALKHSLLYRALTKVNSPVVHKLLSFLFLFLLEKILNFYSDKTPVKVCVFEIPVKRGGGVVIFFVLSFERSQTVRRNSQPRRPWTKRTRYVLAAYYTVPMYM